MRILGGFGATVAVAACASFGADPAAPTPVAAAEAGTDARVPLDPPDAASAGICDTNFCDDFESGGLASWPTPVTLNGAIRVEPLARAGAGSTNHVLHAHTNAAPAGAGAFVFVARTLSSKGSGSFAFRAWVRFEQAIVGETYVLRFHGVKDQDPLIWSSEQSAVVVPGQWKVLTMGDNAYKEAFSPRGPLVGQWHCVETVVQPAGAEIFVDGALAARLEEPTPLPAQPPTSFGLAVGLSLPDAAEQDVYIDDVVTLRLPGETTTTQKPRIGCGK